MNYSKALFGLFFICVACNSKNEIPAIPQEDEVLYSDDFYIKEVNQSFGYDDLGYFDTSYQVQYFGMCSFSNTSNFRISNSNYNCDDTFNIILDNLEVDTFLNMDLSLKKVDYGFVDSAVFIKSLQRATVTAKAQGSEFNPSVSGLLMQQGINGLHYGFVDSTFANKMYVYYSASFIVDSIQLGVSCECYALDCFEKLEDFERITRSIRLK
ncbi:MAG: hypothetical protein GQ574_02165 [Crocinitomix sp.]|nr:hypothetical protein [Crocinitomix sp.]